jgi:hypothetical protein
VILNHCFRPSGNTLRKREKHVEIKERYRERKGDESGTALLAAWQGRRGKGTGQYAVHDIWLVA